MNYISSIANQFPGKFLVCKSQIEDFNDGSILTVNPGELAIFVNNGVVAGIFSNGRHELTTQNFPFLNSFRKFLANGQLTFHCSVFFVSETQSCEVLWGFPLPVRDPIQNIYTKIFVRGSYTVRVSDGGKLLVQLMGMNVNFMSATDIKAFFGNRFQQQISNTVAQYISQCGREVLDICTDNIAVSEAITPKLAEVVEMSGLCISNFCISAMQIDANDPNRRILEAAYAKRREMEILGNDYQTIKDVDIRTNASMTPFAGVSFARNDQHQPNACLHNTASSSPQVSEPCQQQNFGGDNRTDFAARLGQLRIMLENRLISEEEYIEAKTKILNQII